MGFVMHGGSAGQASTVHSLEQMTNDERVESVVYETKKVAFIRVHDSCRSQVAEALGRRFAGDAFESYSAGTETKPQIDRDAVRLMGEIYGIDMEAEGQRSKLVCDIPDPDMWRGFVAVQVVLGVKVLFGTSLLSRPPDLGFSADGSLKHQGFIWTRQ